MDRDFRDIATDAPDAQIHMLGSASAGDPVFVRLFTHELKEAEQHLLLSLRTFQIASAEPCALQSYSIVWPLVPKSPRRRDRVRGHLGTIGNRCVLRAIEEGSQLRVKLWLVLRQPSQFTLRTATSLHNLVRVLTIRRLHRGLPLNFVQVNLRLLHRHSSNWLAEPVRRDYMLRRKLKGSLHWLESVILPATSVRPGSSVSCRLRKLPNRSA